MTDPPIYDLGMTDTEYAALIAKNYNPTLERQLLEVGEDPSQALKLTRLVGLLQDKPPETEPEWSEVIGAIEDICSEKTQL
ncbi:hypothetical protein NDI44_26920 [Trichocoleus sp. DQ-A3]|uniref:hypothetical protein n=1 Tax=Cyanophyceae TaxID=3028117 RepID=UPI001689F2B6|nr:hypothetical protein [Coleofasciculus sp. FACHB-125]MBD1903757.1 hypothetical protein [Coleofasciculus sp. FACHB-125]